MFVLLLTKAQPLVVLTFCKPPTWVFKENQHGCEEDDREGEVPEEVGPEDGPRPEEDGGEEGLEEGLTSPPFGESEAASPVGKGLAVSLFSARGGGLRSEG
jgi:hypothetical protein